MRLEWEESGWVVSKLKDGGDKGWKMEEGWRGIMEDKMTLGLIEIEDTHSCNVIETWLCQCHCVGECALLCVCVCVCTRVSFFLLKFNSHCLTSPWCPRKSSVKVGSWGGLWWVGVCLSSMYVCVVSLWVAVRPFFLFALIPAVALAFHSLSAISPLPCSDGEDGAKIPRVLTIILNFLSSLVSSPSPVFTSLIPCPFLSSHFFLTFLFSPFFNPYLLISSLLSPLFPLLVLLFKGSDGM